jgi:hypothetical protein
MTEMALRRRIAVLLVTAFVETEIRS